MKICPIKRHVSAFALVFLKKDFGIFKGQWNQWNETKKSAWQWSWDSIPTEVPFNHVWNIAIQIVVYTSWFKNSYAYEFIPKHIQKQFGSSFIPIEKLGCLILNWIVCGGAENVFVW